MKSEVAVLAILLSILVNTFASSCSKEFNLYDNYGFGYEITCEGLNQTNLALLDDSNVANEIILKIQNSRFQNVNSSIFRNVGSIRYLYLDSSNLTFPQSEAIFNILDKLEYLNISDTEFPIHKDTFSGLKSLKDLILSNNSIQMIPRDSLEDLESLDHLQITDNILKDVDNIPFCKLENLKKLNLSNNEIESLYSKYLICNTQEESSIDLSLNDQPLSLEPDNFSTIDVFSSDLMDLDLSNNNLKALGYFFNSFRYIRILNLHGNQLSKIKKSNFRNLNISEEICLSNNQIKSIDRNTFQGKEYLTRLDLSHNKMNNLLLDDLYSLKHLNLGHNNLTESCLRTINISLLEELLLNNNDLSNIESGIFMKFKNLKILDLSMNHVKLNNDSFKGLSQLKILKLDSNAIEELPGAVFRTLKNLENLDLSNNEISSISNENILSELDNLLLLNLSHNHLSTLDYGILKYTKDLRVLDIGYNRLHSIQYEQILSHLPLMSVLNIRSNLFSCESLVGIIKFLKDKKVNYTTKNSFDIDGENISGVYCDRDKNITLSNTEERSNYLLTFSIVIVSICFIIITGVLVFRIYVYVKRRQYRADEFELIDE